MPALKDSRPSKWLPGLKLGVGICLLGAFGSHAVTGLLGNLGWYAAIGLEYEAWHFNAAYQSGCWFAMGIGLALVAPIFYAAVLAPRPNTKT